MHSREERRRRGDTAAELDRAQDELQRLRDRVEPQNYGLASARYFAPAGVMNGNRQRFAIT